MTLHDAIIHVLREAGRPLTAREIRQRIVGGNLYRGKDGQPPRLAADHLDEVGRLPHPLEE